MQVLYLPVKYPVSNQAEVDALEIVNRVFTGSSNQE